MNILDLPNDILINITLYLDITTIHVCRQTCKSFNNWIKNYVWQNMYVKNILIKRLNYKWKNGHYIISKDTLHIKYFKPYIIGATSDYIIIQSEENLNSEYQQILFYNMKKDKYWKTPNFGPVKTINVLQQNSFLQNIVYINKKIYCICYEDKESFISNFVLLIFSTKNKKIIHKQSNKDFIGLHFDDKKSFLIVMKICSIETLELSNKNLISKNAIKLNQEIYIGGNLNSTFLFPYLTYWQKQENSKDDYEIFVWKINKNMSIDKYHYYKFFKNNIEIYKHSLNLEINNIMNMQILDLIYIQNYFVLLVNNDILTDINFNYINENKKFYKSSIIIIENNRIINKINLCDENYELKYFKNIKIINHLNRVIMKCINKQDEEEIFILNICDFKISNTAIRSQIVNKFQNNIYRNHSFFDTINSNKNGYFYNETYFGNSYVIENENIVIKKYNFS